MIRITAHAKINLFLEITGKRPDGYHTLSTVFQTISLGDELTVEPGDELYLSCSDSSLPTDERNLVMRAAVRLRVLLNERRGAKIHLEKKVPMGAGLGGGSSDAAAALKSLLALWQKSVPEEKLASLALALGADVPFFLKGGACLASGIGEKLSPLPAFQKTWLVLVYPGFGVPTKDAYAKVVVAPSEHLKRWVLISEKDLSAALFNRFEEFVCPAYPAIAQLKEDLLKSGAKGALMSGSGSSVFGLATSEEEGAQILTAIQKKYNQAWLIHTL